MKFGLFSESGNRGNPTATKSYEDDVWEIVTAEQLGFSEVWVAERGSRSRGQSPDIVSAANLLISKAAALTSTIRLGTGIRPLPHQHPFNVATEANMCDHLTGGRYMLGYGGTHGLYGDHHAQLGIKGDEQRAMTYEAIDYIMKCFTSEEPFDFDGEFWHGRGVYVLPRPLQKPHVPIAAACSGNTQTIEIAARNGFMALLGRGGDPADRTREMGDAYVQAAQAAGLPGSRNLLRVVHYVHVSDSVKQAVEELRPVMEPRIEQQKRSMHWDSLGRWVEPGEEKVVLERLNEVTFDRLIDAGRYFIGDPDTVYEAIKNFYHRAGGFGVLLVFAAQGDVTREQWERSMRLLAEEVAPRLEVLDPDRELGAVPA